MKQGIGTVEAAQRLGVDMSRVKQLIYAGQFPSAYQIGQTWVLDPAEVERYRKERDSRRHSA